MKRKIFAFVICIVLVMAMPLTASADMGPKPSVRITFTGIEGETYYGTLLSLRKSTGPASAWDGNPEYAQYHPEDEGYEIWLKFVEYEDTDGYYFLQEWWDCSESNQLNWTYYPPTSFKILLYFPETDSFYVSPVYERYAFDSYFTVDLSAYDTAPIMAHQSYDYTWELISLAARIVLTIALELGIALLFGYREKKVLACLAAVNIVTQVTLNVALNIINYNSGSMSFTFSYVLFEILLFAIEAVLGYSHQTYFCFIEGYMETVFAVDEQPDQEWHAWPVAYSFREFLRLILACGSAELSAQSARLSENEYGRLLELEWRRPHHDLDGLGRRLSLTPIRDPFAYTHMAGQLIDCRRIARQ